MCASVDLFHEFHGSGFGKPEAEAEAEVVVLMVVGHQRFLRPRRS